MDVIKFYSCCLIILISLSLQGNAQQKVLQQKVNVNKRSITMENLGSIMSQQVGLVFAFNSRQVRGSDILHLTRNSYTVEELLTLVQKVFNTQYRIYGDHVIFRHKPATTAITTPAEKRPPAGTAAKTTTAREKEITKTPAKPQQNTFPKMTNSSTVTAAPPPVVTALHITDLPVAGYEYRNNTNSRTQIPTLLHPKVTAQATLPIRNTNANSQPNDATVRSSSTGRNRIGDNWPLYIAGGLTVDENLFITPTVKIGIPYVYAIGAYTTNFNVAGFRYGIGAQLPIADNWKLQLNATTGKLSRAKQIDSMGRPTAAIDLRANHHIISLVAERQIGERLLVQGGINFNIMKYAFYYEGNQTRLDSIPGTANAGASSLRFFKPLLGISDNFSPNRSGYTATWIGLQIGVFYRIK